MYLSVTNYAKIEKLVKHLYKKMKQDDLFTRTEKCMIEEARNALSVTHSDYLKQNAYARRYAKIRQN